MGQHADDAGFTLLEALVVLVITSMVSVVLVQGFGLILGARGSVENKLVGMDQAVLQQNLLLEPLRGLIPDYKNEANTFTGAERRLQGLTTLPLLGRSGTPVGFSFSLDYDSRRNETTLTYQEVAAAPRIVGRWEGDRGAFSYRDRSGDWSDVWPPPRFADSAPQTPWLIRVEIGSGFPSTFIASVQTAHQRRARFADGPMGSGPKS